MPSKAVPSKFGPLRYNEGAVSAIKRKHVEPAHDGKSKFTSAKIAFDSIELAVKNGHAAPNRNQGMLHYRLHLPFVIAVNG